MLQKFIIQYGQGAVTIPYQTIGMLSWCDDYVVRTIDPGICEKIDCVGGKYDQIMSIINANIHISKYILAAPFTSEQITALNNSGKQIHVGSLPDECGILENVTGIVSLPDFCVKNIVRCCQNIYILQCHRDILDEFIKQSAGKRYKKIRIVCSSGESRDDQIYRIRKVLENVSVFELEVIYTPETVRYFHKANVTRVILKVVDNMIANIDPILANPNIKSLHIAGNFYHNSYECHLVEFRGNRDRFIEDKIDQNLGWVDPGDQKNI